MPRGGKRQGQPGTAYANRTDLAASYDNAGKSAAGGQAQYDAPPPQAPTSTPDDSPMLLSPTARPDEPITAGLANGPGPGPEALGNDPRMADTRVMRDKWMPLLSPIIEDPDTPESVKMMFRYLRGA